MHKLRAAQGVHRFFCGFALAISLVVGLWGCADDDPPPAVSVMGDSLSDVGTFGLKFTVQDSANPKGFPLWTQLVATGYGSDGAAQCSYFVANQAGTQFSVNATQSCSNFAIGGGRIVAGPGQGGPSSPLNINRQMQARASLGGFAPTELVLVDGGGNDAADLVGAYLGAGTGAAGLSAYQQFLLQQLDGTTVANLLTQPNGAALAAGAYMQKLAETFHGQIVSQLLDKGAQRVVVLNVPDISLTPRFRAVLQGVTAQAGQQQAQLLQGAIRGWIAAFNTVIAARSGSDPRLLIVDFNATLSDIVQNFSAARYALTDATGTACPPTGAGPDGLPAYDFPTCTSRTLDAVPGRTAGWWKNYLFSDGFHPTPRGHELMAQAVRAQMDARGWR